MSESENTSRHSNEESEIETCNLEKLLKQCNQIQKFIDSHGKNEIPNDTKQAMATLQENISKVLHNPIETKHEMNNGTNSKMTENEYETGARSKIKTVKSSSSYDSSQLSDLNEANCRKSKRLYKNRSSKHNHNESTSESSSSRVDYIKPKRKKEPEPKEENKEVTENELIRILIKQLDTRKFPKLDAFDENKGVDIESYLDKFEEYCKEMFKGKNYLWINELAEHLNGQTLQGFLSLKEFDDSYEDMKRKLIRWYNDNGKERKRKARKKFENAQMKANESTNMYGTRLLTLYKNAYPEREHKHSKTLAKQFKSTVPKQLKRIIDSQILNYRLMNKNLSWKLEHYSKMFPYF